MGSRMKPLPLDLCPASPLTTDTPGWSACSENLWEYNYCATVNIVYLTMPLCVHASIYLIGFI